MKCNSCTNAFYAKVKPRECPYCEEKSNYTVLNETLEEYIEKL